MNQSLFTLGSLFLFMFLLAPSGSFADEAEKLNADASVSGVWLSQEGDGLIEVSIDEKGELIGVIAPGIGDPNKKDTKNPDESLRDRTIMGSKIMWGFKPVNDQKTKWKDGTIYDPNNGKTYSCKLKLDEDGKLNIRGYIGISLFGRTAIWTRYQK